MADEGVKALRPADLSDKDRACLVARMHEALLDNARGVLLDGELKDLGR